MMEEENENVEVMKLEHQLSSHRHMIEQLEKELQLKNSKIEELQDKVLVPNSSNAFL
jgi:hypothetical protein